MKYEAGDLDYLRFDLKSGSEIYVVSQKRQPETKALATAMANHPAFVSAYTDHVESLEGALDDVPTEFPEVRPTDRAVAERRPVRDRVEAVADRIAGELHRFEGDDYGTFAARIDGSRWELNWDRNGVSYLRVGGSNGVYLVSQYQQPEASDVREYVPKFASFVEAYNEEVEELETTLSTVEI